MASANLGGQGIRYDLIFGYDEGGDGSYSKGRLTSIDDPMGKTAFTYDPSGSVNTYERTIDELDQAYFMQSIYDNAGNIYRMTYSDGRSIYYDIDHQGMVKAIRHRSLDGAVIASFDYDEKGRVVKIEYGNGVNTIYDYVGDLLIGILTERDAEELYHVEYEHDGRGRRSNAIYHDGSKESYEYDPAGRLVKVLYKSDDGSPDRVQTYSYDSNGNRMSYGDQYKNVSYTYDTSRGLVTRADYSGGGGWKYSYDAFGRLVERKHILDEGVHLIQKYTWNNGDQLVKVESYEGGDESPKIHDYSYDAYSRREKRVRSNRSDYVIYGKSADPMMEVNSSGEVVRDLIYIGSHRVAAVDGETISFFHLDDGGSTLLITDEDGKVSGGYRYDPFGNVNFSIGTIDNPYRFAGKHYDDETGFIYFGGRYYDPVIGRFISPDPANEGGNLYAYMGNSPFGAMDVFGWFRSVSKMFGGGMIDGDPYGYDYNGGPDMTFEPAGGMTGPSTGDPSGFMGFLGGIFFSLINVAGVDVNFSPQSTNPISDPFAFAMGADGKDECDDEECYDYADGESESTNDVWGDPVGDALTGQDSNEPKQGAKEDGDGSDSSGSETGGYGPKVDNAPNSDGVNAGIPGEGSEYSDPRQVEGKIDGDDGSRSGGSNQTSDNSILSNDSPSRGAQLRTENNDPTTTGGTDPVMLHNGEVLHVERDLKIPGRGMDYEFVRTYRSRIEYDGPVGYNWDHNFNKRLIKVDKNYCDEHPLDTCCAGTGWDEKPSGYIACYVRFDGEARYDAYKYNDEKDNFEAPLSFIDRLTTNSGGVVTIRDSKGVVHEYANDGYCTKISDRFGNEFTLDYQGDGDSKRLQAVTDTLGRTISYGYNAQNRLSEVEDFTGGKVRLTYDADHNLVASIKPATPAAPDGATTRYTYSSGYPSDKNMLNHNMLSITDPLNQKFSGFAYSFTDRVVWQRFGEEAFTIETKLMGAWPKCETEEDVSKVASRTTLTDRNGNERLFEFNCQGNALKIHRFMRGLVRGEPEAYVTSYSYDLNSLRTSTTFPKGNSIEVEYQDMDSGDSTVDRLFAANPVRVRKIPDANRGGDVIEIVRAFEPVAMQPLAETRANVTRTYSYDYQEGASVQDIANAMGISQAVAANVFADVPLNLGDQNGDGTTVVTNGALVRIDDPDVTDMDGNITSVNRRFVTNGFGQIVKDFDPTGVETRYEYYSEGGARGYLERKEIDPDGLSLTTGYIYDDIGHKTRVTDAAGGMTQFQYDARGNVTQLTDATGAITKRMYDADDNLIRLDRPALLGDGDGWITTKFAYNELNRPTLREDEVRTDEYVVSEFRYDGNENQTRAIEPMGNSVVNEYDERDLLVKKTQGYGTKDAAATSYAYDANGNVSEMTDPVGAVFTKLYDGHDRVVEEAGPLGVKVKRSYDEFDRPTVVATFAPDDTLIKKEEIVYDALGRIIAKKQYAVTDGEVAGERMQKIFYDAAGRKVSEVNFAGDAKILAYNSAGQLISETDSMGNELSIEPDGMDRPIEITKILIDEFDGSSREFAEGVTYDGMGRVIAKTDSMDHVTRYGYDPRGNLVWQADGKGVSGLDAGGDSGPGNTIKTSFDGLDRKITEERELRFGGAGDGAVTSVVTTGYAYDDNSNFISITDSNDNATEYSYDSLNRRISTILPGGSTYIAKYDVGSRLVETIDPRNTITRMSYDLLGRRVSGEATQNSTNLRSDEFEYDALGRLGVAKSFDGSDVLTSFVEEGYDGYGRHISSAQNGVDVMRTYTLTDKVQSISTSGGYSVMYERDGLGRIDAVTESGFGQVASMSHMGGIKSYVTLGNGIDIDYTYDQLMRITSKESVNSNAITIAGYSAGYDMAGNRLYEAHAHDGGKGEVYKYDSLYRLTDIAFGVENPANEVEEASPTTFTTRTSYSFDPVNNWTTKSTFTDQADLAINTNDTYAINDLNQYAQISKSIDGGAPTDESLVYDEAGNLIGDGEKLYVYDDRNLLTEVRDADDNALIARYAYDALRRRISGEKSDGTITDYIYDGWQVVEERISDVVAVNYIYNDGIDDPIAMIAGSDIYYYDTDLRHNISTMTNALGGVIERYTYDAYGEVEIEDAQGVAIAQSAIGNAYLFSSRRYDSDTGLYYYRNRMYSPSLGRFLQRDPMWYEDGLNLYAYVGNNSVMYVDPMGTIAQWEFDRNEDIDMTPNSDAERYLQYGLGVGLGAMVAVPAAIFGGEAIAATAFGSKIVVGVGTATTFIGTQGRQAWNAGISMGGQGLRFANNTAMRGFRIGNDIASRVLCFSKEAGHGVLADYFKRSEVYNEVVKGFGEGILASLADQKTGLSSESYRELIAHFAGLAVGEAIKTIDSMFNLGHSKNNHVVKPISIGAVNEKK